MRDGLSQSLAEKRAGESVQEIRRSRANAKGQMRRAGTCVGGCLLRNELLQASGKKLACTRLRAQWNICTGARPAGEHRGNDRWSGGTAVRDSRVRKTPRNFRVFSAFMTPSAVTVIVPEESTRGPLVKLELFRVTAEGTRSPLQMLEERFSTHAQPAGAARSGLPWSHRNATSRLRKICADLNFGTKISARFWKWEMWKNTESGSQGLVQLPDSQYKTKTAFPSYKRTAAIPGTSGSGLKRGCDCAPSYSSTVRQTRSLWVSALGDRNGSAPS